MQCLTAPRQPVRASLSFHSSEQHQHSDSPHNLFKHRSTQIGAQKFSQLQITDDNQIEEGDSEKTKRGQVILAGLDMETSTPSISTTPKEIAEGCAAVTRSLCLLSSLLPALAA